MDDRELFRRSDPVFQGAAAVGLENADCFIAEKPAKNSEGT